MPDDHPALHQSGHPGAGNDVRPPRQRDGQHGGHPRRGRHRQGRERHRQKRKCAGPHRARLQPGGR